MHWLIIYSWKLSRLTVLFYLNYFSLQVVDANKDMASMQETFKILKSKILFGYDADVSWDTNTVKRRQTS